MSACRVGGDQHPSSTHVYPLSIDERQTSSPADVTQTRDELSAAYAGLSDGQIWFVVDTLEAGEVDRARAALPRLARDDVRRLAKDMIAEHEPMRDRLLRLAGDERIAPILSEEATRLKRGNEATIIELLQAGTQIDSLYVGAQTAAHREALRLLSGAVAVVDSELLRDELRDLRRSVATQLEHALELASASE